MHKCWRLPADSQEWLRIPRKKGPFQTTSGLHSASIYTVGKIAFGIEAEYLPSGVLFLIYHTVFILLGFSFWVYWLKQNPGDLQNASVPLFTVLGLIAGFWTFYGK